MLTDDGKLSTHRTPRPGYYYDLELDEFVKIPELSRWTKFKIWYRWWLKPHSKKFPSSWRYSLRHGMYAPRGIHFLIIRFRIKLADKIDPRYPDHRRD